MIEDSKGKLRERRKKYLEGLALNISKVNVDKTRGGHEKRWYKTCDKKKKLTEGQTDKGEESPES